MARTHQDVEDELLVLRCQEGDGEALRALFLRWQPRLLRLAWRLTGEAEAARDVVQDAWVAIVRSMRRLDDPARFRAWACRIVGNRCADWTRRRVVRRGATKPWNAATVADAAAPPSDPDAADEAAEMRSALAALPGEQRAILSLHYLEGMGVAEIARVLDVPAGTVKSRLYHARNRLRLAMERVEP